MKPNKQRGDREEFTCVCGGTLANVVMLSITETAGDCIRCGAAWSLTYLADGHVGTSRLAGPRPKSWPQPSTGIDQDSEWPELIDG